MLPSTDPLLGALLPDGYRIFQLLGGGGTSRVYVGVAHPPSLADSPAPSHVAVKVLRPELARSPELLAAFEREAETAARIRHPNVVRVLTRGALPGGPPYLVAELLRGLDLAGTLARARPLAPRRAVHIARGVASGLEAAHREGIVHGDLKPENIFLVHAKDGSEIVKLLDFGASCSSGRGTPGYAAPELAREGNGSVASDIYSLGVVLFEMLTGRPPGSFEGKREAAPSGSTRSLPPLASEASGLALPASLDAAVARALAVDPRDRFASMTDFRGALNTTSLACGTLE
jgi:serine/threonine-protein kinase